VIHLFCFDPFWWAPLPLTGYAKTGAVRTKFLLECIADLRSSLEQHGQRLFCFHGPTASTFETLSKYYRVTKCFSFSEVCSEEQRIERSVRHILRAAGGDLILRWGFTLYHIDDLMVDPWRPNTYRTYSAFRRAVQDESVVRAEAAPPRKWQPAPPPHPILDTAAAWLPEVCELCGVDPPRRDDRAPVEWVGGERAALSWLHCYVWGRETLARHYVGATNTMSKGKIAISRDSTSKLSPWLAHGALSARRLFHEVERYERRRRANKGTQWLKHELVWRDYLRFACLAWRNEIFKRDGIGGLLRGRAWRDNGEATTLLRRWVDGTTGFPFVDCFMRELRATGYTTHCGRECACWFLVRDLGIDWRLGAEYFEHILIDYEPSANWGNWAYRIATTAPPRLLRAEEETRSTEMLLWAQQHDKYAVHVRVWLPELASLPSCLALEPWRMLLCGGADDAELLPPRLPWACPACTMQNEGSSSSCSVCETASPPRWGEFVYGDGGDYPLPMVKPKLTHTSFSEQHELEAQRALSTHPVRPYQVPIAATISQLEPTPSTLETVPSQPVMGVDAANPEKPLPQSRNTVRLQEGGGRAVGRGRSGGRRAGRAGRVQHAWS